MDIKQLVAKGYEKGVASYNNNPTMSAAECIQKGIIDEFLGSWLFGQTFYDHLVEFHSKYNIAYTGKPRVLPPDEFERRQKWIDEEYGEYKDHMRAAHAELQRPDRDEGALVYHLAESLDALVDLTYVVLGTAQQHGFNFNAGWARVHYANMQKQNATDGNWKQIIKPLGWTPPNHSDLVEDNAHGKS